MKHIIHVSGYSLVHHPKLEGVLDHQGQPASGGFGDWEHVCWGDPAYKLLGRIPKTLLRAFETRSADTFIVWSTGASRLNGVSEARWMFDVAMARIDSIPDQFPDHFREGRWFPAHATPGVMRSWLRDISMFEESSTNTLSSMRMLSDMLDGPLSSDRVQVLLVSSRNHVSRLARDAERAIMHGPRGTQALSHIELDYSAAHTCYGGKTIADTQVNDLGA